MDDHLIERNNRKRQAAEHLEKYSNAEFIEVVESLAVLNVSNIMPNGELIFEALWEKVNTMSDDDAYLVVRKLVSSPVPSVRIESIDFLMDFKSYDSPRTRELWKALLTDSDKNVADKAIDRARDGVLDVLFEDDKQDMGTIIDFALFLAPYLRPSE